MSPTSGDSMFPIEKSNLYQIWWEEREHIAKNRWYLSEKVGYDVGIEAASHNWNMCHRKAWIEGLKKNGRYPS